MDGGEKGKRKVSGDEAAAVVKAQAASKGPAEPKDESSQGFRTPPPQSDVERTIAQLGDDDY